MFNTSKIVADLVIKEFVHASSDGRDCRLIVPGITDNIGMEIHSLLRDNGIKSYLVVSNTLDPNEDKNYIQAVGLTSKRIGSFVTVVMPGQLSSIQDSIRGSGGAIRSVVFSEEWPWVDDGSEHFKFDGPFLDNLLASWSDNSDAQSWLRELILGVLLKDTRLYTNRSVLFLEEILGLFNPNKYNSLHDIREKFLYHTGLPNPGHDIPKVTSLEKRTNTLCSKISDRYHKEENIRQQAKESLGDMENISGDIKKLFSDSIDFFIDGLGQSTFLGLGSLSLYNCWGPNKEDTKNWENLNVDLLETIFNIIDAEISELSVIADSFIGLLSKDRKTIAINLGEKILFSIQYRIINDFLDANMWKIQLKYRQLVLHEVPIDRPSGSFDIDFDTSILEKYAKRKILVKIVLLYNEDAVSECKIYMHLCNEKRPYFVILRESFSVIDAAIIGNDDSPDKKFTLIEPEQLVLFNYKNEAPLVIDQNDQVIETKFNEKYGAWVGVDPINLDQIINNQLSYTCKFPDDASAVICFEAGNIEKGKFTLEEELISAIALKPHLVQRVFNHFQSPQESLYPFLGNITGATRKLISLYKYQNSNKGWRPLLVDMFSSMGLSINNSNNMIETSNNIAPSKFSHIEMPAEIDSLLIEYSKIRDLIIAEIEQGHEQDLERYDHPPYAICPIYKEYRESFMYDLLEQYANKYFEILTFMDHEKSNLDWGQLFVVLYLDCIVHWGKDNYKNKLCMIGPLHPLVLCKRFMVQKSLYLRAKRFIDGDKDFSSLVYLLSSIIGYRWSLMLSSEDKSIEASYVSPTSDPGWHVQLSKSVIDSKFGSKNTELSSIIEAIRNNFGIETTLYSDKNDSLATNSITTFHKSFPDRRSIGIQIKKGYSKSSIISSLDKQLHSDDVASEKGESLSGGVRLHFESSIESDIEATWSNPPIYAYTYENDDECMQNNNPDIFLLPPFNNMVFKKNENVLSLPRGTGLETVYSKEIVKLTEGHTQTPNCAIYEFDDNNQNGSGLDGSYRKCLSMYSSILGEPLVSVYNINLPEKLNSPWVIVPGNSIDPAVLVKYVRDGIDRSIQDRALWDYRLDISDQDSSYYVLSTIPKSFNMAINNFFSNEISAEKILFDLGRIGIAIGGDAMRSGKQALGIIGVIGAVRLLMGSDFNKPAALPSSDTAISFLIPVDSFISFFGNSKVSKGKRCDLLAVTLNLSNSNEKMMISAYGIESKFVSGIYDNTKAIFALEQAQATFDEFRNLVIKSKDSDGIPERLALVEIISFGMRIISPSDSAMMDDWAVKESKAYKMLLSGDFIFQDTDLDALLVSTEKAFPGVPEHNIYNKKQWVRLTQKHWPEDIESDYIKRIRQTLLTSVEIQLDALGVIKENDKKKNNSIESIDNDSISVPDVSNLQHSVANQTADNSSNKTSKMLQKIYIGSNRSRKQVYYDPKSSINPLSNLHIMITGSSGKGKTQFLKYMICKIRDQGINVLLVDMKNDFASDRVFCSSANLDTVYVAFDGLPYNPLIPSPIRHPGTGKLFYQCGQHISGISAVLKTTYNLGAQQQMSVKNAVIEAFESNNIPTGGSIELSDSLDFPNFSSVGESLKEKNVLAYNRLDPLFTLDLFRQQHRESSFSVLTDKSLVLDLSQIPSDEIKNALAQMIVMSSHSYYNAQQSTGEVRQYLIFDEAHRVLSSDYIERLARECRSYGVGLILSSQSPLDFPSVIADSLDTKIALGNGSNIDAVKRIMQLIGSVDNEHEVSNLGLFEAFINNMQYPHTYTRLMNYPLYLVWKEVSEHGTLPIEKVYDISGIDFSKLSVDNLLIQLEKLGLVEVEQGVIKVIS